MKLMGIGYTDMLGQHILRKKKNIGKAEKSILSVLNVYTNLKRDLKSYQVSHME